MGYKDISLDEIRELRDHGVEPSFIGKFKDLGFADISIEKAIELRDPGDPAGPDRTQSRTFMGLCCPSPLAVVIQTCMRSLWARSLSCRTGRSFP